MGQMLQTESRKPAICGPPASESSFSDTRVLFEGDGFWGTLPPQKGPTTMRTRYFGWERVFEHIWQHCNHDGIWIGNDETLAAEFHVSEDEAYDVLSELCGRGLIEMLVPGTFAITKWPERDDPGEEELER